MTIRFVQLGCLLLVASGCAARPARFETSDAPPPEAPKIVEVSGFIAPQEARPEPRFRIEMATSHFLLALQNRAPEQLESILAPGATVREETSGTGNAALPTLLHLSSAWSATRESEPERTDANVQVFGPARVLELQTQGHESWVTVAVEGPKVVQGIWRIRIDHGRETPEVAEIILPKAN